MSTITEYRSMEYRHRVWKYRVPPPNTKYQVPSTEHREDHHQGSSTVTECRVPSTECSPSIENHHRVSSTVTEYRVPSPSIEVWSTTTEYRVPPPSINYHHRVSKYRVPPPNTEYRVPSTHRILSTEYRVPNIERTITEDRVPSPSVEY